jgi:hypothetical protein
MKRLAFTTFITLFFTLFFGLSAHAGEVTKIKGKGVLLRLDGESADVGDKFFLVNSAGKKKAIVQITKVKGNQALARVTAGKAEVGMTMIRKDGGGGGGSSSTARHGKGLLKNRSYWGGMLGYGLNNMNVTTQTTPSISTSMSGSSFGAQGIFDYELFDRVWFRGGAGYQGFSAQSGDSCVGGTCNANIGYLDLSFLGRYLFTQDEFRPWAGLGFDMLFPLTKSSTALDSSSMNNTGVIIIAAGFDWSISPTMYIPVSLEYGMFPKSSTVDANWIVVRAGVAVPF